MVEADFSLEYVSGNKAYNIACTYLSSLDKG